MNRRSLFLGLGVSAMALAIPKTRSSMAEIAQADLGAKKGPRADYFPNYTLTTHENKQVKFYDDLMAGQTVMVNFMYTNCEATCPLSTMNLKKVYKALGEKVGGDVKMLSFSIKPEQDTPEKLAQYVADHKIGKGWTFLTGKPEEIEILRRKLGFFDPDPSQDVLKGTHIGILRVGNERLDRWAACPILQSPESIVKTLDSVRPRGLPRSAGLLAGLQANARRA
jgi:protein SCO1/2